MPITQDRFVDLIYAADKAIARNKVFSEVTVAFIDNETQDLIKSLQEKGYTDDHPFAKEIQRFIQILEELADRANQELDLECIEILARERATFSLSRQKANLRAKSRMTEIRKQHRLRSKTPEYYLRAEKDAQEQEFQRQINEEQEVIKTLTKPMEIARRIHEKMLEVWTPEDGPLPAHSIRDYLNHLGITDPEEHKSIMCDLVSGGFITLDNVGDFIPQLKTKAP